MGKVKGKNTSCEMVVRKLLWSRGYRYRLHDKSLPGKPDIVFSKKKKAIFVNGCFWHGHSCKRALLPSTNNEFWHDKILGNVNRDKVTIEALQKMGWGVLVIWQCGINKKSLPETINAIKSFLC